MSAAEFYTSPQRALQEEFHTETLAQAAYDQIVWEVVEGRNKDFIESRDFFFIATVDGNGMPTVSYKGGATGVVQVVDSKTLMFPNYDGNGMFMSMGNATETGHIGLLFMDFERPMRIRVQGEATVHHDAARTARFPGANLVVEVAVKQCFFNCARYIHKHKRVESSRYVPDDTGAQPLPSWKRLESVQHAITEEDRRKVQAEGGLISQDEYMAKVESGDS